MKESANLSYWYEFGPYRLNARARVLRRDGLDIPLTPKLFDTLLLLIEHCGEVVEREDFIRVVWQNMYVEEGNLSTNIYALRKALGDDRRRSLYITTVPRRGYRFIAAVRQTPEEKSIRQKRAIRVLAILPFKPLHGGEVESRLELGLADALITRLSNLRQIALRPTSAVRNFRGTDYDPSAAGRELQADAVVEGSLQCDGQRLRVRAQLVSVHTSAPLWADQFDAQLTDHFDVEDIISAQIAEALIQKLQQDF
jgi:DNA-binding winged helix-turn-helix (wHTH) protein